MAVITELAPAKINLALHVRARRADGYHDIETLFAFIAHGDVVSVSGRLNNGADRLTVTGPFAAGLDHEGDNLALRAARLFHECFGTAPGHDITLEKNLPVASGIGGGSADAAATLRALARHNGIAVDDSRLFDCADALGSDVPACLMGRTAIGSGRGERLLPVDGLPGRPALLVNPGVAVPTGPVFAGWDGVDRGPLPGGDVLSAALAGRNDLQEPACAIAPVICEVLEKLSQGDAVVLARMSGSGATCFALYENEAARAASATDVRAVHPGWWCLETALV